MPFRPVPTCVLPGSLYNCSDRVRCLITQNSHSGQSSNMPSAKGSPKNLHRVAQSAAELQGLLTSGVLTSTQLMKACLPQVERHDHQGMNLHAMIAATPKSKVLDMAKKLDTERQNNRLRGPFHGLPIIVKVYLNPFAAIGPSLITQPGCFQH